jgi:uncharacterized protein YsxB (DUF464 family)
MTKVNFDLNDSKYKSIKVEGHAMFANKGKDIVCAGISAIIFGTLNALDANEFTGLIDINKSKGIITIDKISSDEKTQTIIDTMFYQLKTIEQEYKKYIKIRK